ncbi:hypothetical protein LTAR_01743 [Leptolinea tardivitalis]|nr:hypothetical protein LTAR_01743 [Leptolinea tardivitalis]
MMGMVFTNHPDGTFKDHMGFEGKIIYHNILHSNPMGEKHEHARQPSFPFRKSELVATSSTGLVFLSGLCDFLDIEHPVYSI